MEDAIRRHDVSKVSNPNAAKVSILVFTTPYCYYVVNDYTYRFTLLTLFCLAHWKEKKEEKGRQGRGLQADLSNTHFVRSRSLRSNCLDPTYRSMSKVRTREALATLRKKRTWICLALVETLAVPQKHQPTNRSLVQFVASDVAVLNESLEKELASPASK